MKEKLIKEWIDKAEEDYLTIINLHETSIDQFASTICFHTQQCAEKYLKALLISYNIEPPWTYSLETLLDLIDEKVPELKKYRQIITYLTPYSVEYRYPGIVATPDDVEFCINTIQELREIFRKILRV